MARMENGILYIRVEDMTTIGDASVMDKADNGNRVEKLMKKWGAHADTQCLPDPNEPLLSIPGFIE